jgi:hypothetical protein
MDLRTGQGASRPRLQNGYDWEPRDIQVERRLTSLEIDGTSSKRRLEALERTHASMQEAVWKFTRGAAAVMASAILYHLLFDGRVLDALRAKLGF